MQLSLRSLSDFFTARIPTLISKSARTIYKRTGTRNSILHRAKTFSRTHHAPMITTKVFALLVAVVAVSGGAHADREAAEGYSGGDLPGVGDLSDMTKMIPGMGGVGTSSGTGGGLSGLTKMMPGMGGTGTSGGLSGLSNMIPGADSTGGGLSSFGKMIPGIGGAGGSGGLSSFSKMIPGMGGAGGSDGLSSLSKMIPGAGNGGAGLYGPGTVHAPGTSATIPDTAAAGSIGTSGKTATTANNAPTGAAQTSSSTTGTTTDGTGTVGTGTSGAATPSPKTYRNLRSE